LLEVGQDIGGFRRDDVFLPVRRHDARHAAQNAARGRIIADAALGLFRHAVFQDLLIFRRQRGLLPRSRGLGWIELDGLALVIGVDARPLAFPVGVLVGILGVSGRLRAAHGHHQRESEYSSPGRASLKHDCPPTFGSFIDREGRDIHASVKLPMLVFLCRTHSLQASEARGHYDQDTSLARYATIALVRDVEFGGPAPTMPGPLSSRLEHRLLFTSSEGAA
jgi:hypothetical protein